jgi:hypothetical protein
MKKNPKFEGCGRCVPLETAIDELADSERVQDRERVGRAVVAAVAKGVVKAFGTHRDGGPSQPLAPHHFSAPLAPSNEPNAIEYDLGEVSMKRFLDEREKNRPPLYYDVCIDRQSLLKWLRNEPIAQRARSNAIAEAVDALWPKGRPKGMMIKERNKLIDQWLKDAGRSSVGDRTKQRWFNQGR